MPAPGTITQPPTSFVGREREIAVVRRLLGQTRLLTLTGPGGSGKTRLALRIAAEMGDAFPDGVYFVPLAAIRDPQLVLPSIAQALHVQEGGQQALLDALQERLHARELLLVLDNCEQVVAGAPAIAAWLAACPGVKALVTSREALHIYGEQEFAVPALTLPDAAEADAMSVDDLRTCEAIRLFEERARAVQSDFRLTAENAPAVLAICRRLDGLPLAIELAAARSKLFTPSALLARLGDRAALRLLTAGARDLPARQQTLRDCIAWSYDLLSPWEQRLFWRLAVCAGGCTLDAAAALMRVPTPGAAPGVAGDIPGAPAADLADAVLEGAASLVDKSLLTQRPDVGGEPRFAMLETIREFAGERLGASGELAAVQRQHATYYLALAIGYERQLRSPQQLQVLHRLDAEHDNFRAALSWAMEADESEIALRLAGTLGWFWHMRGYVSEGRNWLRRVLSATPAAARTRLRALVLTFSGVLAFRQSDLAAASAALEDSAAISRAADDREGLAYALAVLSLVILLAGDPAGARSALDESISLFRATGNAWGLGLALRNLGEVISTQGDLASQRALLEESVAIFRQIGDKWGLALALTNLSETARDVQSGGERAAQIGESLSLFEELGDKQGMAWCLVELARVLCEAGAPESGAQLLGTADALLGTLGARPDPVNQAAYERTAAALRDRLAEAAWTAARVAGRALTPGAARSLAAATLAAVPALPPPAAPVAKPDPARGPYPADLTAREVEVLRLTAAGLTDAEVAARLIISRRTVQAHLRSIFSKLGISNRTAATRFALEHDLA